MQARLRQPPLQLGNRGDVTATDFGQCGLRKPLFLAYFPQRGSECFLRFQAVEYSRY